MELNIARRVYDNYFFDKRVSFSEYALYIQKGIYLWQHSKTFPSDSEGLKAVKIAIEYRTKLMKLFPAEWKNYFTA